MKKKAKWLFLLLAAALLFSACGQKGAEGETVTYQGVGNGRGGEIKLEVTLEGGKIKAIKTLEQHETPGHDKSLETLAEYAVEHNQVPVDGVAGASLSSKGFVEALKDALAKGNIKPEDLQAVDVKKAAKETIEDTADVIIVGAGGAGLSAAIRATEAGADVIVMEKLPFVGGNTLISGAEYAAPGNWIQKKEGIEDSPEIFVNDLTVAGGKQELIRTLADNALDGAIWLRDDVGVVWEDELMFFGGHSVKRSLIPLGASGKEIITKLKAKAKELGITVYTDARVTKLLTEGNAVVGVEAQGSEKNYVVKGKAVVLTTGGFGSNIEMRKKANPEIDEKILSTNSSGSTGDGIILAQELGADVVDMKEIQLYPICDPLSGALLYVDDTRLYQRTIMVNKEGKRFVEELGTRYEISMAMKAQSDGYGYELWDQAAADFSKIKENHPAEIDYLLENNLLVIADTLEECADHFGIDKDVFLKTVETWNGYVDKGVDPDFNKRGTLHKVETGPFWMIKAVPAVHHTMGGIVINPKAQVLRADGSVIKGLFAAGEVTGGVHGNNRLGSAAIADITVFGIIAGENAAAMAK
ncbi:MAG: flavocytochrome c [Spirochaetales bacterium]|nr:MAG: flavocytochrome c [Spirochaetales bacterium]